MFIVLHDSMRYHVRSWMVGCIILFLSLLFILGFTGGIHADVGNGNFFYMQFMLFIPIVISIYGSLRQTKKITKFSWLLAVFVCAICLSIVYFSKREINSDVQSVYENIGSLAIGYIGYLIGFALYTTKK